MALTFLGGIPFGEYMNTHKLPLTVASSPSELCFYLIDGTVPTVSRDDIVAINTVIAQNEQGFCIMSTVSGRVLSADSSEIRIQNDFQNTYTQLLEPLTCPVSELDCSLLTEYAKKCGLVDAQTGIPIYKTIENSAGKAHRLVVNCTETEPASGHKRAFCRQNAAEIVLGAKLLLASMGIKKAIFAVNEEDTETCSCLDKQINDKSMLVLAPVMNKYPGGDRRLLIASIYHAEIPLDLPPEKAGYTVFSAETVYNLFNCLKNGSAVNKKAITVSGNMINSPANLYITIGSSVSEAVACADGIKSGGSVVSKGCLLNGITVDPSGSYITGYTNQLIVNTPPEQRAECCIHCSNCVAICPMHLLPYRLFENYKNGSHADNIRSGLYNCIECGCCAYVCPGGVDLLSAIRNDKSEEAFRSRTGQGKAASVKASRAAAEGATAVFELPSENDINLPKPDKGVLDNAILNIDSEDQSKNEYLSDSIARETGYVLPDRDTDEPDRMPGEGTQADPAADILIYGVDNDDNEN